MGVDYGGAFRCVVYWETTRVIRMTLETKNIFTTLHLYIRVPWVILYELIEHDEIKNWGLSLLLYRVINLRIVKNLMQ